MWGGHMNPAGPSELVRLPAPTDRAVDFALTAPDGRTGHYRIEVCATTDQKAAD